MTNHPKILWPKTTALFAHDSAIRAELNRVALLLPLPAVTHRTAFSLLNSCGLDSAGALARLSLSPPFPDDSLGLNFSTGSPQHSTPGLLRMQENKLPFHHLLLVKTSHSPSLEGIPEGMTTRKGVSLRAINAKSSLSH